MGSSLVLVQGVSFQAKFIRATRLARIEKVVRKLLFAGGRNRLLPCDGIQSSHCRRWSIVEKLGFLPGQTFTTNATFKHLHQHLLAQKKSRAALMTLIHIFTTIYRAQTRIQCKERWICRASSKNLQDVSNAVMIYRRISTQLIKSLQFVGTPMDVTSICFDQQRRVEQFLWWIMFDIFVAVDWTYQ